MREQRQTFFLGAPGVHNISIADRHPKGADLSFDELLLSVVPHAGYRRYFQGPISPEDMPYLFSHSTEGSDFPTVTFAEGWAFAEQALRNRELCPELRMRCLGSAALLWDQSCHAIRQVYDHYPGRFLLWPGTRWRYQLSLDTLPAMEAVVANEHPSSVFNTDLIGQSLDNTRETLRILLGKHRGILEEQAALLDDPSENARAILRA